MQNHQFDLKAGESVSFGNYKLTLLEIENDAAVLEIEGPDGEIQIRPLSACGAEAEQELVGAV